MVVIMRMVIEWLDAIMLAKYNIMIMVSVLYNGYAVVM